MPDALPVSAEQAQYAQLALYVHDRDARLFDAEPRRTEVILADAGLPLGAIAALTGRNYETVKTTVRRARASASMTAKRRSGS